MPMRFLPGRRCAPLFFCCSAVLALGAAGCNEDPLPARAVRLEPLWIAPLEGGTSMGAPAAGGGRVYVEAGPEVRAVSAEGGGAAWRWTRPPNPPANLLLRGGRLVGAGAAAFSLDAATGAERWRVPLDSTATFGRVAADDAALYAGTSSHRVHALRLEDGGALWSTDVAPEWGGKGVVGGVAVAGDTLFATVTQWRSETGHQSSGWVVALDRATGGVLWRFSTGQGADRRNAVGTPAVHGDLVLASDYYSNAFFAVDRRTGRQAWRVDGDPGFFGPTEAPVVVDGVGYVASADRWVYAFDPATGAIRWKTRTAASSLALAVCGGRVFANHQGLTLLDRETGAVLDSRYGTENEYLSSAFAVEGGRVYVAGNRGLYAFACASE